jgi:hypothetical protein
VIGSDPADPRWQAAEEAVEFWNGELANSGVALRLGPIAHLIQPVPDWALRELSAWIGNMGAQPIPSELALLPGASSSRCRPPISSRSECSGAARAKGWSR